jgi:hypothetical protein
MTACEIDNRQSSEAKANGTRDEKAFVIGAAVNELPRHMLKG